MGIYNRKLFFNRGGQVNARGTGITSGLTPVQNFQTGGQVDPMDPYRQAVFSGMMTNKTKQGDIGGYLDVMGQSMGAANQLLPKAGADEYFWAYNTKTSRYERVTEATFNPEVHTKDAPAAAVTDKPPESYREYALTDPDSPTGPEYLDFLNRNQPKDTSSIKFQELETDDDGKVYAIFVDPEAEGDAKVSKVDTGLTSTKGEGGVNLTGETFPGADGHRYQLVLGDDGVTMTAVKIPGQEDVAGDTEYRESVDVFTKDADGNFTVPTKLSKFTEGADVTFKDSNNKPITGDQFIYRGDDAEENMWVYDKTLGHMNWIKTSDYNSTMHRKEAPEILKGFEYTSIDDIDGKKYAIFTNPALEGDASVKKVEIGNADPETVKQGSVLDNTFQGLDGFEYEKYVDDDGLVKARKLPGQQDKDVDTSKQFADKTMVKGTVTIDEKTIPASFIQTDSGDMIIDPIKNSDTYGERVLLSEWLEANDNPSFNIEPNIPKEMNAEELLALKSGEFNLKTEQTYVENIFAGVEKNAGINSGNNKKIQDANQLLSMLDLTTTGSYADQRNAMLRLLQTFELDEAGIELYNKFEAAIKGGNLPATEVVSALSQSGVLNRAMAWSQQLNNTEVGLLINSGNQLFLTKEGQALLATINKRDAEIKQKAYRMYLDGMKNREDKFDLAVKIEEYRQGAYDEFGNSDEMKKAINTIKGITGIQGLDFFAAQPDITIEGKKIKLGEAYTSGALVFGGYADTKKLTFLSPDGVLIRPPRPDLPLYFIKVGESFHIKQFELDGPE